MRSSPGDASERRVKHRPRPGLGWFNWMILTAVLVVSAWWFHFREPPARPPELGEHGRQILEQAGVPAAQIDLVLRQSHDSKNPFITRAPS